MLPYFGETKLGALATFVECLSLDERKGLITLSRSQVFPLSSDTTLLEKTRVILDKMVADPPYEDYRYEHFTEIGSMLYEMITTPYLNGLVITLCLGASLPESVCKEQYHLSFSKELLATQTRRQDSYWNWNLLIWGGPFKGEIVHPDFPVFSRLQHRFTDDLRRFRQTRLIGKIIKPHYTRRGISSETGQWILNRSRTYSLVKYGYPGSFHGKLDRRNVKSRDVIHHYIRTGSWAPGRVEMRQQWKPSILTPRTYFAWGGNAIRTSCYLREFFNMVADVFDPSHRHKRVQPDWLKPVDTLGRPSFLFYDLTSFTSWFHEQEPFLRELASFFSDTPVYLVGEGVYLFESCIGSLIMQYVESVNSFPEFYVSGGVTEARESMSSLYHLTAGFLGVPGNLVTCTLAHGLAQASGYSDPRQLQVPGDDVGCETRDEDSKSDRIICAQTLGKLQMAKTYHSDQASIYLKRGVRLTLDGVNLTEMLIWPLFPYLQNPDLRRAHFTDIRVDLPERKTLIPRACRVIVQFIRNIWKMRHGDLPIEHKEFIIQFLTLLHQHLGLPTTGVLQGRYVTDTSSEERLISDVSLKYPVDIRYLESDPDRLFAEEYVETFIVRDVDERGILTEFEGDIIRGSTITVYRKQGWSFLEDMGYLKLEQRFAGEKVYFIGADAKDAFLSSTSPRVSTYKVLSDISTEQLISLSILPGYEGSSFERLSINPRGHRYIDLEPLRSYNLLYPRHINLKNIVDTQEVDEFGPDGYPHLWRDDILELDEDHNSP